MMAPAKREAERLVHEHWDAIDRVAAALIERGELSGNEVDALLAAEAPPRIDAAADP
jgi:ATP-dependent Zn protease